MKRRMPNHWLTSLAHHEAAHATVAYEFNWWVRQPGVHIGTWPCACLGHGRQCTTRASISIYMAGRLAEEKYYGVQGSFTAEDVVNHWHALRTGTPELRHPMDPRP